MSPKIHGYCLYTGPSVLQRSTQECRKGVAFRPPVSARYRLKEHSSMNTVLHTGSVFMGAVLQTERGVWGWWYKEDCDRSTPEKE